MTQPSSATTTTPATADAAPASHRAKHPALSHPASPVIYLLQELASVVDSLSDAQYTQHSVGDMPGTIGGHVRHCLDHTQTLLDRLGTGLLDYDDRKRGTDIETNRQSALTRLDQQITRFKQLPENFIQADIRLRVMMAPGTRPIEVNSSIGRELAFVLSHTIHHNAIIGAMVRSLGVATPERFGYAPATPRQP